MALETAARMLSGIRTDDHIRGDLKKAKVILIEYADYQCLFCADHHVTMQKLMNAYGDDIAWIFRHFPLPTHAQAMHSALVAECAGEQGNFWEFSDLLFANQELLSNTYYRELADDLGVNHTRLEECTENERYGAKIMVDVASGENAGVTTTPTTFVNGRLVAGSLPYERFVELINFEIDKTTA